MAAQKYSAQNYMRRTADDLSISGAAVIVLGAWSFLKFMMSSFLDETIFTPELLAIGLPPLLLRVLVAAVYVFFGAVGISLHLYIGLSARAEARGRLRSHFYLFVTGLFLILTLLSCFFTFARFFRTSESDASAASLLIDMTLSFTLISIIVSSRRMRALRESTQNAKDKHTIEKTTIAEQAKPAEEATAAEPSADATPAPAPKAKP